MSYHATLCHYHGGKSVYAPKNEPRNRDRITLSKNLQPCLNAGGIAVFVGEPSLLTREALDAALETLHKIDYYFKEHGK